MNFIKGKVLLLILDGIGFNRSTENKIIDSILQKIDSASHGTLKEIAGNISSKVGIQISQEELIKLVIDPIPASLISTELLIKEALDLITVAMNAKSELSKNNPDLNDSIKRKIEDSAKENNYIPWFSKSKYLIDLRNDNLSIPTKSSGKYAGFEDLTPPVQGTSEAGHQQIGNLIMAAQTTREITESINDGSYFTNEVLLDVLKPVVEGETNLNFCFMISGEHGNDGNVHSAWNHLEAFLELIFTRLHINPSVVKMEAILDGRDCPPNSSIEEKDGVGNFLGKLRTLLQKYNAVEIVSWVIGRGIGMDRDYSEANAKADYQLMMGISDQVVKDFDDAMSLVSKNHKDGFADTDMKPILILDKNGNKKEIQNGDVFIDLNFRPDRQRAKIAALAGDKDFLVKEAKIKQKKWKLDWIRDLKLDICTITEYHKQLSIDNNIKIAYPIKPLSHNILSIFSKITQNFKKPFTYLLLAESNKALHMGYFIRGRKEEPEISTSEERVIISSWDVKDGIYSDDDFYKKPEMKNFQIKDVLINAMENSKHQLIAANISNCDMIGHLMLRHYEAAIKAFEFLNETIEEIIQGAVKNGYTVIITADHGNIEDFSASHSSNDIFTTFVLNKELKINPKLTFEMRLFDIGWCIADILGIKEEVKKSLPEVPQWIEKEGFVGRSIFKD